MGSGLLDAISVPLTGLIVRGVVLGLGHGGTEPTADSATPEEKERGREK